MSELTRRIAEMPLEERIRLEERLLAARKNGKAAARIPRRGDDGPAPLSYTQERLWFLAQLEPDSPAYNETSATRIRGPLNLSALESSLDLLAARHDSLRVCFREVDHTLMQVAEPLPPTRVPVVDLSEAPVEQRMERAWQHIDAQRALLFDLAQPPLWRVLLIRLAQDEHIFVWTTHHIISDGWSSGIFWRELGHCYAAFAGDQTPAPLPDLPISCADFSVWQRQQLQGESLAKLVSYWRSHLAGVEPLNLPTDSPRSAQPSHKGNLFTFQLSRTLSESISLLTRTSGATNYMLMLAAFQLLLYRYTGQTDIAVGSPIAGRTRSELEGIYGFFVNALVLRTNCAGNPTFRSLLGQVRQTALDAYQHQDLPFEKLVEELQPARDLRRNPFVDVLFSMQNVPRSPIRFAGAVSERVERTSTNSKFDLSLYLDEQEGVIGGRLEYATDLFAPATIERMAGHFQTLLAAIAEEPDSPIDSLPLLTSAERHQLLEEWNRTAADYPSDRTIHQLFTEQAARTPNAVAVVDGDRAWTYSEIEATSNRLAHHLLALGVQPGQAVGIWLERSAHKVVAMLAALKAGAAWLPLDPSNPEKRLQWMAADAGVTVIICTSATTPYQPSAAFTCLQIDQPGAIPEDAPNTPPPCSVESTAPAYYLYTSGSTGQPKGVVGSHRGAVNRMHWMWRTFPFAQGEVACQRTSAGFVDSVWETFGPLLRGCPLVIAPDELVREPAAFVDFLAERRISRITVVPALLVHLLDFYEQQAHQSAYPSLWICSGEPLSAQLANRFHRLLPQARLLNLYGSSEVAGDVTYWESVAGVKAAWSVPIGRPIDNTEIYLLDPSGQPVPIGVAGELYVGGAGLALGYLNRPDLTTERFVPHPFRAEADARLYRTGDLARYRADGVIEFLGRLDRQVKIRGFRVEPGEIEAVLREHPAVRDGVVGLRGDEAQGSSLIAWWIEKEGQQSDESELRDFLRQRLPDYMIPASLVQVDSFPLNPNGKVDLHQLPAPANQTRTASSHSPATSLERQLLAIWQKVLGRSNLGVDDNFFDVGGHSLLAVRLMDRVSRATHQQLLVASLFYGPTVRQQARLIQQNSWTPPWVSLVSVQPEGKRPPLFLVPPAASTGIRFAQLARILGAEQPVYGFDPPGLHKPGGGYQSVREIATHFINEIRQLQPEGPYLLGGMCFGGHVAYEMAQLLGDEVPVLILLDAAQPANGPSWSLPPRNILYYWRRIVEYRQDGHHWTMIRKSLSARWQKIIRRLRNWSSPESERMGIVYSLQLTAMRQYQAEPTNAALILFQSDEAVVQSRQRGWLELSKNTSIIHFPNTTHHSLLLEDENVERIAHKLQGVIEQWMTEHWNEGNV